MRKILFFAFVLSACGQSPASYSTMPIEASNGITPIQLCPNVKPTYPTTFPEVAFCIDDTLYAVYSANDGFLTSLPLGAYTSNAIGSACNFVVGANCSITY